MTFVAAGPLVSTVRAKHLGPNTAEYTARPTALTMAVASKVVIDALYHLTFHFCIKKIK